MGAVNPQLVLHQDRGAVWVLTMNRPEARNALSTSLISTLHTALMHADRDPSVRALIMTRADPAFCAGLDLKQEPIVSAASPDMRERWECRRFTP